jgi:hypothetical protein
MNAPFLTSLIALALFFFAPDAVAGRISPAVMTALSATMDGVYKRIEAIRDRNDVLRGFDRTALRQDSNGWTFIEYVHSFSEDLNFVISVKAYPVDVVDVDQEEPGYQVLTYPQAGIKIGLFVRGRAGMGGFNLLDAVRIEGIRIEELQQAGLPLRLSIRTPREPVALGQKLEFDVVLGNVSSMGHRLKRLDEDSLSCLFNGQTWGKGRISGVGNHLLSPGESLTKKFSLMPSRRGDFEIFCSYGLGFSGLRPSARTVVRVE